MNYDDVIWVHRTHFQPLFINTDCMRNGKPVLLTHEDLRNIDAESSGMIFALPEGFLVDESITAENSGYLEFLTKMGISREECLAAIKANYEKQAKSFFESGLYTIYKNLNRTASPINKKKLNRFLKSNNLGFNNSRGISMDAAIVLDISPKCFDFMGQKQIYEKSDEEREILTEYFGFVKTNKVVPAQHIKQIVIPYGNSSFTIENPNYDKDYIPKKNGTGRELFDDTPYQNLQSFIDNPDNEDSIIPYIKEIKLNATEKEYELFLRKAFDLCSRNEKLQSVADELDTELDSYRTPYERAYLALKKCTEKDISDEQLEQIVLEFLKLSEQNLQSSSKIDYWYRDGNSIVRELLPRLNSSSKANDIIAEIGFRDKIIEVSDYKYQLDDFIFMYDNLSDKKFICFLYGINPENVPLIRSKIEEMDSLFKGIIASPNSKKIALIGNFYQEMEKYKTPYEEAYLALKKCDPEENNMTDIEKIVLEFLQLSKQNLQATLQVDPWYIEGNKKIQDLLPHLKYSPHANDIIAEIGLREKIIEVSDVFMANTNIVYTPILAEIGELISSSNQNRFVKSEEAAAKPQSQPLYRLAQLYINIITSPPSDIQSHISIFMKELSDGNAQQSSTETEPIIE